MNFQTLYKLSTWPRVSADSPLDGALFILMEIVLAFSTDGVRLDKGAEVQRTHLHYAHLLQRYLKHRFGPRANSKFVEGVMLGQHAKEANEIVNSKI